MAEETLAVQLRSANSKVSKATNERKAAAKRAAQQELAYDMSEVPAAHHQSSTDWMRTRPDLRLILHDFGAKVRCHCPCKHQLDQMLS
eukprot:symbB.v1.2.012757.t1/scaffold889.1/size154925/4